MPKKPKTDPAVRRAHEQISLVLDTACRALSFDQHEAVLNLVEADIVGARDGISDDRKNAED